MARYLITGGDGYLAQQIINNLLYEGHFIRLVDSKFSWVSIPQKFSHLVEQKNFELTNKTKLVEAFDSIDVCFHLATPNTEFNDYDQHASAMLASLHVFHSAIECGNVPVIFSSTDSVYGPNVSSPLFETAQMMPTNSVGVHKLSLEHHARILGLTYGLPSMSMRLFNVYGMWREDWDSDVITRFCRAALLGQEISVYGNGDQVRDFIHIDDVARAFIIASKYIKSGHSCYNVCTGQATSIKNVIAMISSLLGQQLMIRYERKRMGDLYCAVGSNLKVMKELNFIPRISLDSGLRKVLKDAGAITLQKVV